MRDSYEIFLKVADELNFTKVANQKCTTQQNVSYHIQKIEKEFNTKLFERKPELSLTPAGKILKSNLQNLINIEDSIKNQINDLKEEVTGNLRFGINPTRARILLPNIITKFNEIYPKIEVSFILQDTHKLETMLLEGDLDAFLGINTSSNDNFIKEKVFDEEIYFLCTKNFFIKNSNFEDYDIQNFITNGITLNQISQIPVVRNLQNSTMNLLLDVHYAKYNITPKHNMHVSDYDIQIGFCGNDICAAFCPTLILNRVFEYNKNHSKKPILYFKLNEIQSHLNIEIVYSSLILQTNYLKTFISLMVEELNIKYSKF